MTLKDSRDEYVRGAGIRVRTGRKWSAPEAVETAESRLRQKDIVGAVCVGRQGLGTSHTPVWKSASTRERRALVQTEVRQQEEENRHVKAVGMGSQGAWTRWETEPRSLSWSDMWNYTPWQLKFLLRAVYDLLPTPSNLARWGLIPEPDCPLCGKRCTLERVLSSCNISLSQGRYTWRHDQVLKALAHALELTRLRAVKRKRYGGMITFVKEGESIPSKMQQS